MDFWCGFVAGFGASIGTIFLSLILFALLVFRDMEDEP